MGGFPLDFNVSYPIKEVIYLPPFSTGSRGYQMCLQVFPNGFGDGKGTHLSIFMCMMKGLYDDELKWPFRGAITIQIVNQLENKNHYEKTFQFDSNTPKQDTVRVTNGERSKGGWGLAKLLAHDKLGYNASKNTQYLKDGIIIVRIMPVTIAK